MVVAAPAGRCSRSLPLRLIAMEIVRSCGGCWPSMVLISPARVTATGAVPLRGRAWGEILPLKETRRLPSWVTSAAASEAQARRQSAAAAATALLVGLCLGIVALACLLASLLGSWSGDERPFVVALAVLADHPHVGPGRALQRLRLLTSRPFLPPCIFRTNLVTGASGTTSKVLRMPPLTESIRPASSTSNWPLQGGDQVGQRVVGGAQVDRAFQRLVEQRRGRLGVAVDRGGGAVLGGELDPGADGADVAPGRGTPSAAG